MPLDSDLQRQLEATYRLIKRFHSLAKRANGSKLARFYSYRHDNEAALVALLRASHCWIDKAIVVAQPDDELDIAKATLLIAVRALQREVTAAIQQQRPLQSRYIADCLKAHTQLRRQLNHSRALQAAPLEWQPLQRALAAAGWEQDRDLC